MSHYWLPDATSGTGTGNWSATGATGHWADDAAGTNLGKAAPGVGDSTIFTNGFNGAGQTVTVNTTAYSLDMNWTGATNNPTLLFGAVANFYCYGSLTFIPGMTYTQGVTRILSFNGVGNHTITLAGKSVGRFQFAGTGTWALQDAFTQLAGATTATIAAGTLNTNGQTVTLTTPFVIDSADAKTITMGASVVNTVGWSYSGTNLTVTANTATINVSGTGALAAGNADYNGASFGLNGTAHTVSGNFTASAVNVNGASSTITMSGDPTITVPLNLNGAACTLVGNSTVTSLNLPAGTTQTITFTDGTTQTATTFTLSGSAGHIHTLQGTGTAGWNMAKAGGGNVIADYLSVSYSTVT